MTWTRTPRSIGAFPPDIRSWQAWDEPSHSYNQSFVNPGAWSVISNFCGSRSKWAISGYTFTLAQVGGPWQLTRTSSGCTVPVSHALPAQGVYTAKVTVNTTTPGSSCPCLAAGFEAFDAAHYQPAGDLPFLGVGGERGEVDLGDLRFGDPSVFALVPDRPGVPDRRPPVSGIAAIAWRTEGFIRTVTQNQALAPTAAAMTSRR